MNDRERLVWILTGLACGLLNASWFLWLLLGPSVVGGYLPVDHGDRVIWTIVHIVSMIYPTALLIRLTAQSAYDDFRRLRDRFAPPEHRDGYDMRMEVERLRLLLKRCAL